MNSKATLKERVVFLKKHYNKRSLNIFLLSLLKQIGISLFRFVVVLGLAFVIIYPIIIKLSTSLKPMAELYDPTVFVVPKNPTLKHFSDMISFISYPNALFKSILLSVICGFMQMASCVFVAYGIARFKFKCRGIVFGAVLITMVIPPQAILLPLYIQFQNFNVLNIFNFFTIPSGVNLINTYWPFVLLSATCNGFKNGLYIYLFRQYFAGVPYVLEEAAYIDGCGPYKTFFKIMLPGAIPIMSTVFLLSFVWQFTDGYYSTILTPNFDILSVISSEAGYRLAGVMLENTNALRVNLYNNIMVFLIILPLLILYLFTQKAFVQSIESSGIVG